MKSLQWIRGQWSQASTTTFQGPNTGNLFLEATESEIREACQVALSASQSFSELPLPDRAVFLEALAEELESSSEAILASAGAETHLPELRLKGELARTCGQLRMFAAEVRTGRFLDAVIETADPLRQPLPKPDMRRLNFPIGPVAVFGASNFPLAFSVLGGDTASALAAGCCVVVKAHPAHPETSRIAAECAGRALVRLGLPSGIFSMVGGAGFHTGSELVLQPEIEAVAFTGSLSGGRALFDLCSGRPKPIPVFAEMGSNNPFVILPGAIQFRSEAIAKGLAASLTMGCGQFCTRPGLVLLIASPEAERFLSQLVAEFDAAPLHPMLSPAIEEQFKDNVEGDGKTSLSKAPDRYMARLTVLEFLKNPRFHHEIFGPSARVVLASDAAELLGCLEALRGQLTATLHAEPSDDLQPYLAILRGKVGRVIYNGYPTGLEVGRATVHGGPYPATTDARTTSVGTAAMHRFLRPVCFQDFPEDLLPPALRDSNPLQIPQTVNGVLR